MPEQPFYSTLGKPFIELLTIDSTNNYALDQLHAGLAQHGTAYFAREQVAGKGQRGKTWLAAKDSSLILSIVIDPRPLSLSRQFMFSAAVALAACDLFTHYSDERTRIKWPNDIYWQDRKAGGILIENSVGGLSHQSSAISVNGLPVHSTREPSSTWRWSVVGIGMNINQPDFPTQLHNPVSLKQITGKTFQPSALAQELCMLLDQRLQLLQQGDSETLHRDYIHRLYKKGETVKLKKGARVFEASIQTVTADGKLVVVHAVEEEFGFGEIEWVIPVSAGK